MTGDQAIDNPDLVYQKQPETEAQEAGGNPQVALDPRGPRRRIGDERPDGGGDQHHPGDSADPKEHEVRDGPPRALNQSENEQRNRRGAGKAMDEANDQGTEDLVDAETAELPV